MEKNSFSFASGYQLEIASGLWMGANVHVYSQDWGPHMTWTCKGPVHAAPVSLSSSSVVSRSSCFFGVFHSHWLLQSFCLIFYRVHGAFRRYFMKTFHLGISVPRSLTVWTLFSWVSVFAPIYSRVNLFWWWLKKTLIYEYSRVLLGVILLLCSFSNIAVFGFSLGPWPVWSQVLGHLMSHAWIPAHGVGLKSNKIVVGYSHNF